MAREIDATTAAQFTTFDEQTQADLKYEAWSQTIDAWMDERPDAYERIDSTNKVSWDDMELEVHQDENDRDYFFIVTGVEYAPGHENGKQLFETVHGLMADYREQLQALINDE
jgi:hypothetical protein